MKYLTIVLVLVMPSVLHAAENVRPQGYRHVDLQQAYDRTYGGYWWVDPTGDICEEGITIQGNPLVCSRDTMLVLDASSAEVRDLHFVDGCDLRVMSTTSSFSRSSRKNATYRSDNPLGFYVLITMVTMVTMMIKLLVAN